MKFYQLYLTIMPKFMKTEICASRFSSIITEIDIKNKRSLKAHEAIGFQKIKDYKSGDKIWRLVKLQV